MDKRAREKIEPAAGRWTRRDRKRRKRMVVEGKSVFLLQKLARRKKRVS